MQEISSQIGTASHKFKGAPIGGKTGLQQQNSSLGTKFGFLAIAFPKTTLLSKRTKNSTFCIFRTKLEKEDMTTLLLLSATKHTEQEWFRLLSQHYALRQAATPALAVETFFYDHPSAIVCDLENKPSHIAQTYRMLEDHILERNVPFILLSNNDLRAKAPEFLWLGADALAEKNKPTELFALLRGQVEKSKKIRNQRHKILFEFFQTTSEGVIVFQDNRSVFANRRAAEIFDTSCKKFRQKEFLDFVFSSDKQKVASVFQKCLAGHKTISDFQFRCLTAKKRLKIIKISAAYASIYGRDSMVANLSEIDASQPLTGNWFESRNQNLLNFESPTAIANAIYLLEQKQSELSPADKLRLRKLQIQPAQTKELTKKEQEVLRLTCEGYTYEQMAEKLFLSPRGVESRRAAIYRKTNTKNLAELIVYAIRHGYFFV